MKENIIAIIINIISQALWELGAYLVMVFKKNLLLK